MLRDKLKSEKQDKPARLFSPIHEKRLHYGKILYATLFIPLFRFLFVKSVAAADMWDKAGDIMKSIYDKIITISTIAAVVTVSIALLLMNFSKSGKTVDESRAWVKRIIITWAILNGLGFIMSYVTPLFSGGKWTP